MHAATSLQLYELYQRPMPDTLTPNQKIAIQARRWREERNWWIAALTFLLWGLLYRFYALMLDYVQLQEEHARLQRGAARHGTVHAGMHACPDRAGSMCTAWRHWWCWQHARHLGRMPVRLGRGG